MKRVSDTLLFTKIKLQGQPNEEYHLSVLGFTFLQTFIIILTIGLLLLGIIIAQLFALNSKMERIAELEQMVVSVAALTALNKRGESHTPRPPVDAVDSNNVHTTTQPPRLEERPSTTVKPSAPSAPLPEIVHVYLTPNLAKSFSLDKLLTQLNEVGSRQSPPVIFDKPDEIAPANLSVVVAWVWRRDNILDGVDKVVWDVKTQSKNVLVLPLRIGSLCNHFTKLEPPEWSSISIRNEPPKAFLIDLIWEDERHGLVPDERCEHNKNTKERLFSYISRMV